MKPLAWRYCGKCGKPTAIYSYPFNKTMEQKVRELERYWHGNLCDSCAFLFAECGSGDILWGKCVGDDNVVECNKFKARQGTESN